MRDDSRKSTCHKLYFGAKMICILSGIEVFVFFLLFALIAGFSCFSWFFGHSTMNIFDNIPEKGIAGYLVQIVGFLAIQWEVTAVLTLRKCFLIFRHYREISPDDTKRISFVLGVLAWWYSYKVCIFCLGQDCIFSLWTVLAISIGWGTSRVTHHFLSIAASRLLGDNEKPEESNAPDERPHEEGEAV